MRAGDVIPQVLAARMWGAEGSPAAAEPAGALPVLRDADGQARGRGVHQVPQPRLPGTRVIC